MRPSDEAVDHIGWEVSPGLAAIIALHGLLYSMILSLIVSLSQAANPRLWLQDYPEAVRAAAPPKSSEEKRLSKIIGSLFMAVMLLYPLFVLISMKGSSFRTLFLYAFGITFSFTLFDLVVLDWVIFSWITPMYLVIPGTEGMECYKDYRFHLRGLYVGGALSLVASLLMAGAVSALF